MNLGLSPLSIGGKKSLPLMKQLEATMLAAVKAAGGSAWYVPDDFLVLGPELVVNGKFDAGLTGWTNTNASASVVVDHGGNVLSLSASGGGSSLNQLPNLEVGKSYLFSYMRRGVNAGSGLAGRLSIVYTDGTSLTFPAAVATVRSDYELINEVQTITKPVTSFKLLATLANSDFVGNVYYDDVSIREVISAKDFSDSTGTTPLYLSGAAGLLFDAAGVTGPELISNPHTSASWLAEGTTPPTAVNGSDYYLGKSCRSVTFPVVAAGGYSVCRARDGENIFNVVAGVTYTASFEYALSRYLATGESISIAVTGSSGIYARNLSAGAPGGIWVSGSGSQPAQVSGGGTGLRPYATVLNSPLTVYVRALSVKVVGGSVASQATAGNRPTITRIPRKFGPELITNGGFDTADGWSVTGSPVISSGGASLATGSDWVEQGVATRAGATYWVSVNSNAAMYCGAWDSPNRSSNLSASAAVRQSGKSGFAFVANDSFSYAAFTATGSGAAVIDNVSVREVLEWSYALTFDGTNDYLTAPATIIGATLTQPYTMIAWGKVGAIGASRGMQGDYSRWVGVSSAGKAMSVHTGVSTQAGTTQLVQGQPIIIETTFDGSAVSLWLNGVKEVNQVASVPTAAPLAHSLGSAGKLSSYFNESLGGGIVAPGVMTDAQRAAVRKFAAAQMGMSL